MKKCVKDFTLLSKLKWMQEAGVAMKPSDSVRCFCLAFEISRGRPPKPASFTVSLFATHHKLVNYLTPAFTSAMILRFCNNN
jgi:hypothetical protein